MTLVDIRGLRCAMDRSCAKSAVRIAVGNFLLRLIVLQLLAINIPVAAQTSLTGALLGVVLDASGRALPGTIVEIRGQDIPVVRSDVCDPSGHFTFPLLPAGLYVVTAHKDGFTLGHTILASVPVTESIRLTITMAVAGETQSVEVTSETSILQIDTAALGRMIGGQTIQSLPLVTRNFTQITNLSPGVLSGVNNAGELGAGSGGLAQIDPSNDGTFVHGLRSYDNSYEFDGIPVTDIQASSIASGGVPIPSPDAIQEFKVQTGLYDASFGERAGANVSLVTKPGTNTF